MLGPRPLLGAEASGEPRRGGTGLRVYAAISNDLEHCFVVQQAYARRSVILDGAAHVGGGAARAAVLAW